MKTVTTREAQHHSAKILEHLEDGEDVIVTRRGKQVARISGLDPEEADPSSTDWETSIRLAKKIKADIQPLPHGAIEALRNDDRY